MREERDKPEYATNRELEITSVEIEGEKNDDKVKRVRFSTSKGWDITYTPKKSKTETTDYKGIPKIIKYADKIDLSELPEKVFQVHDIIQEKNSCKVKLSYYIWTKEIDGEPQTYRYLMKNQFEEMTILDKPEVKTEVVE